MQLFLMCIVFALFGISLVFMSLDRAAKKSRARAGIPPKPAVASAAPSPTQSDQRRGGGRRARRRMREARQGPGLPSGGRRGGNL